jgi:hypothetical protein
VTSAKIGVATIVESARSIPYGVHKFARNYVLSIISSKFMYPYGILLADSTIAYQRREIQNPELLPTEVRFSTV